MSDRTKRGCVTVAAAASELLDRLDDLYDQKPNAIAALVVAIERLLPLIAPTELGRLAAAARLQLLNGGAARRDAAELNRWALKATDELRLHCAQVVSDEG